MVRCVCGGLIVAGMAVTHSSDARAADADMTIAASAGAAAIINQAATLGVLSFSPQVLARWHWLEVGIGGDVATRLLSQILQAQLLAGLAVPLGQHVRLDVLGLLGWRYYSTWGKALLGGDNGVDTQMATAGAQINAMYLLKRWEHSAFMLGASARYQNDLRREVVHYTYDPTSWFGENDLPVEQTRLLGAHTVGTWVTVGFVFDL